MKIERRESAPTGWATGAAKAAALCPLVSVRAPDRAPGVPGDLEDDRGDREADQRVRDRRAQRDHGRARDNRQTDVGIGAGMVAIGDERRAVERPASTGP